MKKEEDKAERVLSMYSRLKQGKTIKKEEECLQYGISDRTFQRDISTIQNFLQNQNNKTGEKQKIKFKSEFGGYRLIVEKQTQLESKELLAICKVLLESRSLVEEEMFPIINKILNLYGVEDEQKLVKEYIANEMHHYVELQHQEKLLDRLWKLEGAVKKRQYVEIRYKKLKNSQEVTRRIKPVGIMFSEFYYYLTAFIENIDKEKEFHNPDDIFPTIYRIDRLKEMKVLEETFYVPYGDRFEEGEFRKRIQFMYGGRLKRIRFKYRGNSLESILDRLPTAKVIEEDKEWVLIQAEVFGEGVDRWIKSQGDAIYDLESFTMA